MLVFIQDRIFFLFQYIFKSKNFLIDTQTSFFLLNRGRMGITYAIKDKVKLNFVLQFRNNYLHSYVHV